MINYLYYDSTTGAIRSTGQCFEGQEPPQQIGDLVCIHVDELPVGDWHIEDGQLVAGLVDTRLLEDAKADRRSHINECRLRANRGSFDFNGKAISCDELSRSDIDGVNGIVSLTGAMPPNWIGAWKAIDNTYVPVADVATWIQFYAAMVSQGSINFAHSQALKAEIDACTTNEQVDQVDW